MGRKKKELKITARERQLLKMLWAEGELTLAQAHAISALYGEPVGYPTMQTRLNRLVEKRLAIRSADRPAKYAAAMTEDQVVRGHAHQVLEGLGRGKLVPLVAHLITDAPLTAAEVAELKQLLDAAERRNRQTTTRTSRKRRPKK